MTVLAVTVQNRINNATDNGGSTQAGVQGAIGVNPRLGWCRRWHHTIGSGAVDKLRFSYDNWRGEASNNQEFNTGNTFTITAGQMEFNGIIVPILFGGQRSITVSDGQAEVLSDWIYPSQFSVAQFERNDTFFTKEHGTVPVTNGKLPTSYRAVADFTGCQMAFYAPAETTISSVDATGVFTATGAQLYLRSSGACPIVIGTYVGGDKAVRMVFGDSMTQGTGDSVAFKHGKGWFQHCQADEDGTSNPFSSMNFAVHGSAATLAVQGTKMRSYAKYANSVSIYYGTNDFSLSGDSISPPNMMIRINNIRTAVAAYGITKFGIHALGPRCESTDFWATELNQTPRVNWAAGGNPDTFNNSLAAQGYDVVYPNTAVRGTDPYKFLTNGSPYYTAFDNTHYTGFGYVLTANQNRALMAQLDPVQTSTVTIVDMRGRLSANIGSPKRASNFPGGNRPSSGLQLVSGNYQSVSSMVLTYPRADSETNSKSRHRVNLTGQAYRVPIGVLGGAFPYNFSLSGAPSGMTVGNQLILVGNEYVAGADYGVINWPSSVTGTYTVTLTVTDQLGATASVTWTIVVGTTGFNFVNVNAGTNGSGTLASPYNTLASVTNGNPTYLRGGTYDMNQKTVPIEQMSRSWLAYNNEAVTLQQAAGTVGNNAGTGDLFFSGMTFTVTEARKNINHFFRFEGMSRVVFFENTFDYNNITYTYTDGYTENVSVLMWTNQSLVESNVGNNWYSLIHSNSFKNIVDRDLALFYSTRFMVVTNNSVENCSNGANSYGHGFYFKMNCSDIDVRSNYSIGDNNTQKLLRIDAYNDMWPINRIQFSYNSYRYYGDSEGAIGFCHEFLPSGSSRFVFRNNLYAHTTAAVYARGMWAGDTLTLSNNVMVSGGTNTNGVRLEAFDGTLVNTGYVAGNTSSGILDASNRLIGANLSNLGTKGSQSANTYSVITGTGFGTKENSSIHFDNFEARKLGAANSRTLGSEYQLNISNPGHASVSTDDYRSGSRAMKMDYAAASAAALAVNEPSSPLLFPKIYHKFASKTQKGYAAFWIKITGTGGASNTNIWKLGRFSSGNTNPYSDSNLLTFTYHSVAGLNRPGTYSGESAGSITPNQYWGSTPATINAGTEVPLYNPATTFANGTWHLYEMEFDVGTLNTANAIAEERWDKTLTVRHGNGTNSMTFKTTANPDNVNFLMTPMNGLDDYSNIVMYMDEAYIDGSRARVVMTDTPVYANWTKWAIQPVITWSNVAITYTKNISNFTPGSTAYMHVFNSSGVLVHSSGGVTV